MFQFRDETYLYFLIVIPLCLLVCFLSTWIGKRKLRQLGGRPTLLRLMPQRSLVRQWVKCILLCLALGLLAVCLARPQYGMTERQQTTQGIEAVVMVDVSNSMWADDVQPNRLERAKLLLNNLVDKMENDKIAVGVFAGEAYPQLPITSDYAAAKLCIDALSPEMVTLQGTNIGAAVDLACKSFTDAQGVGRAVILITDGENHEDGALEAVQRAAKQGVQVYVMGIGTAAGGRIPMPGGGVLTDNQGAPVLTSLNEDMCRRLAQAGKGLYLHIDQSISAQTELLSQLSRLKQGSTTLSYTERDEQFQAVALLVLLLLIIEVCLSESSRTWLQRIKFFRK